MRNRSMPSGDDEYRQVIRKWEELKKDPKKWEEYNSIQAEKVLKHWRKR